jgi:hypothetical protein
MTLCRFERHGIVYKIAEESDNPDLLALLRDTPLPGWIALSYERNPRYFQRSLSKVVHQAIIGRNAATNELIGMFARTVFPAYINGSTSSLGYLGDLRVVPRYRNRIRLVRDGFATLRSLLHDTELTPFYLTSIVADNKVARRLFEARLEGLPTYENFGAFDTLAIKTRSCVSKSAHTVRTARAEDIDGIVSFLSVINRARQFSPAPTRAELSEGQWNGLAVDDFLLFERRGALEGIVAVWDQSHFRQTVVRDYRRGLAAIRPIVNALSFATGLPHLPPQGSTLRQVFLSFLCVRDDDPSITRDLIEAGLLRARTRGAEIALIGAPAASRLQKTISREFRCHTYESLMYLAYWPDGEKAVREVQRSPPFVEIGLL